MNKLITVIVPVYNVEKHLEKCVKSIQGQTYKELEIILVDDGSTDSSGLLCDSLAAEDSRIHVIHKSNGGLSSARNAGLDAAKGDYVGFIDSDDYIAPDFYESLLKISDNPNTIVCSRIARVDETGAVFQRTYDHDKAEITSISEYIRELLLHTGDVSVCSKLFPRSLIGKHRFDETKLNEDLLFMIGLLNKLQSICYTGKIGYYYLCRSNSISSKYGKAIEDMVVNSLVFKAYVNETYPVLNEEANRFAFIQHMAYILLVPKKLRNNKNQLYTGAIKYMRKNFLRHGLFNKYLTSKHKAIMLCQIFMPGIIADCYQKKHQ